MDSRSGKIRYSSPTLAPAPLLISSNRELTLETVRDARGRPLD